MYDYPDWQYGNTEQLVLVNSGLIKPHFTLPLEYSPVLAFDHSYRKDAFDNFVWKNTGKTISQGLDALAGTAPNYNPRKLSNLPGFAFREGWPPYPYFWVNPHPILNPLADEMCMIAVVSANTVIDGPNTFHIIDKPYTSHNPPYYQYYLSWGLYNYPTYKGAYGGTIYTDNGLATVLSPEKNIDEKIFISVNYNGAEVVLFRNDVIVDSQLLTGNIKAYSSGLCIGKYGNLRFTLNKDLTFPGSVHCFYLFNRSLPNDITLGIFNQIRNIYRI